MSVIRGRIISAGTSGGGVPVPVPSAGAIADTVAALRALAGSVSIPSVVLRAYGGSVTAGGGLFVWSSAAAVDDGLTRFNAGGPGSNTAGWRRVRERAGVLHSSWAGAAGDGATDDTDAIQRALDALAADATNVELVIDGMSAVGTPGWDGFICDGWSGKTIRGAGPGCGFKVMADAGIASRLYPQPWVYTLVVKNSSHITLDGLEFTNDAGTHCGNVGFHTNTDCTVQNCYFHDVPGDVAGVDPLAFSVATYRGERNKIIDNRFVSCHWGIALGSGEIAVGVNCTEHHAQVAGNIFKDCVCPIAGGAYDSIITRNTIDNTGRSAMVFGGSNETTRRLIISHNKIRRTTAAFQIDMPGAGSAYDLTFTDNLVEDSQGSTMATDFNNMNGFVASDIAGATVTNNVFKNIGGLVSGGAIVVTNCSDVVVSGNRVFCDNAALRSQAIAINENSGSPADRVNITGNVIVGPWDGIYLGAGTDPDSFKNCSVTNNVVMSCGHYGFHVDTSWPRLHFDGNTITGSGSVDFDDHIGGHEMYGAGNRFETLNSPGWGSEWSIAARVDYKNRVFYIHGAPTGPGIAPPVNGTHLVGDRAVLLEGAAAYGVGSWICVGAGTPGTWVPETYAGLVLSGAGSPEGVTVGSPGMYYADTNGDGYIKKSGVATDTGWQLIATLPNALAGRARLVATGHTATASHL